MSQGIIIPTVGRVVWYTPYEGSILARAHAPGPKQPLAAIIARVWSDTCVNLMVIDANGNTHPCTNVPLVQPNAESPGMGFCSWMPFQIEQAQKTEAAEKALTEAAAR